MQGRAAMVSELLERAEHVHGIVTAKTGGADREWPLFYAWWLLRWSELPELLDPTPTISELAAELLRLDRDYRQEQPAESWSLVYARRLLGRDAGES